MIKPDVAAPGVNVLAAFANAQGADPQWGYLSGTSMASPHIAGLAALYLTKHPTATPAEIKSALMTSAADTVGPDGSPHADPFAQGNGQVQATRYLHPGLLYLNNVDDWNDYLAGIGEPAAPDASPVDASDLNLASIGIGSLAGRQSVTRTVTATEPGTWTAVIDGLPGVDATASPASLVFDHAGEQKTFTVTFQRGDAPLDTFSTGHLTWTSDSGSVRSAIAVRPVAFSAPPEATGTGTTGTTDIPLGIGDTKPVPVTTAGLTRGSRHEGTLNTTVASQRYVITVPEGPDAAFARFDLDTTDNADDLDLLVWRLDGDGKTTFVNASATDNPDERVDMNSLPSGTYVIDVRRYRLDGDSADYTFTSYVLTPDSPDGNFTVTPDTVQGPVGDPAHVTASWSDLAPGPYLGTVTFSDTGVRTVVTIDAGDQTPVEPGTPQVTVAPDATGWIALGADLRVTATGLTPGVRYAADLSNGTVVRTGRAAADGTLDWTLTVTDDVTPGSQTLRLTGPDADLSAGVRITPVKVAVAHVIPDTAFNNAVFDRAEIQYAGHGPVRYDVRSAATDTLLHSTVLNLPASDLGFFTTSFAEVPNEEIYGVLTPLLPDGTEGPFYTSEPLVPDDLGVGTITITPTSDDPNKVTVEVDNPGYAPHWAAIHYRGCDGRYVVAESPLRVGDTTETWNLTNMRELHLIDLYGQDLATYQNPRGSRCESGATAISQNYWATMTRTPSSDASYDPAKPITMTLSNRYAPKINGVTMTVGEGADGARVVFREGITTEYVDARGPVLTRSLSIKEGTRYWSTLRWEQYIYPPGRNVIYQATLRVPPLSLADLDPSQAPPTTPPTTTPTAPPTTTPTTPTSISPGDVFVSGRPIVGAMLTARTSTWGPNGIALTYQWQRDGYPIAGATGAFYRLVAADAGHRIKIQVTGAISGAESVARLSAPTAKVLRKLTATPKPRLVGQAKVGRSLTAAAGTWKPSPVRLTITWYRDGRAIADIHGLRYRLTRADRGHRITVRVTGHRPGYLSATRTSSPRLIR